MALTVILKNYNSVEIGLFINSRSSLVSFRYYYLSLSYMYVTYVHHCNILGINWIYCKSSYLPCGKYLFIDLFFRSSYLFGFQSELDEYLLKLLVYKINAKLFETVSIKYFKSINIENTDFVSFHVCFHGRIDSLQKLYKFIDHRNTKYIEIRKFSFINYFYIWCGNIIFLLLRDNRIAECKCLWLRHPLCKALERR